MTNRLFKAAVFLLALAACGPSSDTCSDPCPPCSPAVGQDIPLAPEVSPRRMGAPVKTFTDLHVVGEAQGDLLVFGTSSWGLANIGTASYLLQSTGTGVTWVAPSSVYTPPTGTGFVHVTSGVQDGASAAVNLGTGDVTGTLPLTAQGAPTGTGIVHVTSGAWDAATSQLGAADVAGTQTNGYGITLVAGVPTWTLLSTAPTGTGFVHVTSGTQDGTAAAVNLGTGDVTGTLPLSSQGAPTGTGLVHTTSGAWGAAATQLGSGDVAGTTTDGYGVVLASGVPTWTNLATVSTARWADERTYACVAGLQLSQVSSVQTVGGCPFNPAKIQATGIGVTRAIVFAAQFYATTGTGEVTLYDVDDNVVIATLTTTSTTTDEVEQALTIGAAATNVIPNGRRKYEVRARFSSGTPGATDQVVVQWAGFIVTYT